MLNLTFRPVSGRPGFFDEIKGWGILLLLLYHAGGALVWRNFLHGDLGTDVFLLVSGLGLALNAQELAPAEFFRRRLLRILPAYWIVLTGYAILNQVYLQHHYSAGNLMAHYFAVHALFGDGWGFAINDSFWFITAILLFYVCFLAMRPLLCRPDRFLLVAALLSTAGALLLFALGQSGLTGRWGFRMIDFFLGMLVGHGLREGTLRIPLTPWLGVALLVLLYVPYTQGIVFHPSVVALGLIAAYLLALRPALRRSNRGAMVIGGLAWMGRYSLEIFLIHQPLMREYNRYLHGRWFNRGNPTDIELIMGIALAIGVTLVLAVELHEFTGWLVRRFMARGGKRADESGPTVVAPIRVGVSPETPSVLSDRM
jgi:peptidoglycan/LPS O-acetylase OafA/YrhL